MILRQLRSFPWVAFLVTALAFGWTQYGTLIWRDVVLSALFVPACIWVLGGYNRTSVLRFWLQVTAFVVAMEVARLLDGGPPRVFMVRLAAAVSVLALLFAVLRPGHILAMRLRR